MSDLAAGAEAGNLTAFRIALLLYGLCRAAEEDEGDCARPLGLTASQARALYRLSASDSISLSEFGKRAKVTLPTATGLINRLEAKGLVEVRRKVGDLRMVLVKLSKEGQALREAHWQAMQRQSQLYLFCNHRGEENARRLLEDLLQCYRSVAKDQFAEYAQNAHPLP